MNLDIPATKAKNLIKEIENGEHRILTMSVDALKTVQGAQIRQEDYPEMVRYIADEIDENGGNIDMTDPIIMYTTNGKQSVIGGNHTKGGILSSKKATQAKYIDLGDLEADGWSNAEIRILGILLNPRESKRKTPSTDADFVKTLLLNYETDGIEISDPSNMIFLMQAGCSSKEYTRIIRKASDEIDKKKAAAKLNGVWKKWNSRDIEGIETVEAFSDSKSVTWMMTSALFDWRKIMDKVYYNPNKKNLRILIHHPTPNAEKKWLSDVKPMHTSLLDKFLKPAGYTYDIIELTTIKSETESVISID